MKRIYVTNQCCSSRRAVFASGEINGERPSRNGDYNLWPFGIRETKRIADGTAPIVKNAGAGTDLYYMRTARAVLDLLGVD